MRLAAIPGGPVTVRCLAPLLRATLFVLIGMAPGAAQQGDPNAIFRRWSELNAAGNYPAALVEAQKLEAVVKARFGVNHPDYGAALNNLARVYYQQGKYADAEGLYKRALTIFEKALGAGHPSVGASFNNLAIVYTEQGKYEDAERLHKRALAIREKALGTEHRDVAQTLHNLANVYLRQEKYAEAEGLYKRALAIREKRSAQNTPKWRRPSTTWPSCTRVKASTPMPRASTSARWQSRRSRSAKITPVWP